MIHLNLATIPALIEFRDIELLNYGIYNLSNTLVTFDKFHPLYFLILIQ